MKIIRCDIKGCKKEAYNLVDVCNGYELNTTDNMGTKTFKPFEKPHIIKLDLCNKHFKEWCKATYKCFWKEKWK